MNIISEMSLETGDILLFRGNTFISYLLEYFGYSRYSHVGMVLKNPKFLNPDLEDGLYILESSWNNTPDAENHRFKTGVQIHRLDDILREYPSHSVYVRSLGCERNDAFYQRLSEIHTQIHDKPYDFNLYDWVCAKYNLDCKLPIDVSRNHTKSFWCSALVTYILYELDIIERNVNWTLVAPRELSDEGKTLVFKCPIGKEWNITTQTKLSPASG
jgi:hypothetical protein